MEPKKGWIGIDLDGTLAEYHGWKGYDYIGAPIKPMVQKVHDLIAKGYEVRIFTARAARKEAHPPIRAWLKEHGLPPLKITCCKDPDLLQIWDDRAVRVIRNKGSFHYGFPEDREESR